MNYTIRKAGRGDGIAVVNIFNHYIKNSYATYTESPTGQHYFTQLWQMVGEYPFHIIESEEGTAVGYGLLTDHHPSPAFRGTVEVSYFISPDHVRKGNGTLLLNSLVDAAVQLGLKNILASINSLNEPAIRFHQKNGFAECGRFQQIGQKFEKSFDVVWMQRKIDKF